MKNTALMTSWLLCVGTALAQTPSAELSSHACEPSGSTICLDQRRTVERGWAQSEYLLWWVCRGPLPIPVATLGDPNAAFAGALGDSGTTVVLGNNRINYGAVSGFRVTLGTWLDCERTWGVEARGFLLENRAHRQTVASDDQGNPGIFIPINDVVFGEDSFTVAFPGAVSGQITLSSASRLWGAEINLVRAREGRNIDWLVGFRHLNLEERIEIAKIANDFAGILHNPSNPGNAEPPGSVITTSDRFRGRNTFYGAQIGVRGQFPSPFGRGIRGEGWCVDWSAKLALGSTHQMTDIGGTITHTQPGVPTATIPTSILAGQGNIGQFRHDAFSAVPELEIKLGYDLTQCCRFYAGYNFLYWSNVARPGNQITRNLDERTTPIANSFVPGFQSGLPAPPAFTPSGFYAHGLSFGLELRY